MATELVPDLVRERAEGLPAGLSLSIGRGLQGVPHVERGGQPLFPGYRPGSHADAVWTVASLHGEPVGRAIGLPLVLIGSLTDALETGGLFPSDRDTFVPVEDARTLADRITGTAVFEGDLLLAPSARRERWAPSLLCLLLDVVRAYAVERWHAGHVFHLFKRGHPSAKRFGAETVARTVAWVHDRRLQSGKVRDLGYLSAAHIRRRLETSGERWAACAGLPMLRISGPAARLWQRPPCRGLARCDRGCRHPAT